MAKKEEAKVVEEQKMVVVPKGGELETIPEHLRGAEVDASDLQPGELRLPRLSIAQAMSKAMTPGDSQYLEDLKLYELYNDLTQVIYGRGPLLFIPVKRETQRIEFDETGQIVLDRDVPPNDPRLEWTKSTTPGGKDEPPRASTFVNFISLLLDEESGMPEPLVISIRLSNKHAKRSADRLTNLIEMKKQMKRIPTYGGLYSVDVKPEKNDKGTWGVFSFQAAGLVTDAQLFAAAKTFRESIEGKVIVTQTVDTDNAVDTGSGEIVGGDSVADRM